MVNNVIWLDFTMLRIYLSIGPLELEQAMSTPTYDPFGTEITYKRKLELCQNGS